MKRLLDLAPSMEINAQPQPSLAAKKRYTTDLTQLAKMSGILRGEEEGEWKAATGRDLEAERKKNKLRAAKIAAGTFDPEDTSLWLDKEWSEYTRVIDGGGSEDEAMEAAAKVASGEVEYKPTHKKATSNPSGPKPRVHLDYLREAQKKSYRYRR